MKAKQPPLDPALLDKLAAHFRTTFLGQQNAHLGQRIVDMLPGLGGLGGLRRYVAHLREHRLMLIAADTSKGYWLCETVEEYRPWHWEFKGRALAILKISAALERQHPALLTQPMEFEEE